MLKLKHYLGYDRLVIEIEDLGVKTGSISGTLVLLSKTGARLDNIFFKVMETYSYGWLKGKRVKELVLGEKIYDKKLSLKKDQKYKLKFTIPYDRQLSKLERQEKEGPFAGRWMASFAQKLGNAHSTFELSTEIKLQGSPVKSYYKKDIEL